MSGKRFHSIRVKDAFHFSFLQRLFYDGSGKIEDNRDAEVAIVRATLRSPDEVLIEYGAKNKWGEYRCHATLLRNGTLRDRNCFSFGPNGKLRLGDKIPGREAHSFLTRFHLEATKKPDIMLDPINITASPPMPFDVGILIIGRDQKRDLSFEE